MVNRKSTRDLRYCATTNPEASQKLGTMRRNELRYYEP